MAHLLPSLRDFMLGDNITYSSIHKAIEAGMTDPETRNKYGDVNNQVLSE